MVPEIRILKIWAGAWTTESFRRVRRANDTLGSGGASKMESSLRAVEDKDDAKGKMESLEVIAISIILEISLGNSCRVPQVAMRPRIQLGRLIPIEY